jgi:hypothetical protein
MANAESPSAITMNEEKRMKKLAVVLLAMGLFGAMPVFGAEQDKMTMDTSEGVRQCAMQAESIQEKIARLKAAEAQGTKKYSAKELKKIEEKLAEANKMLERMNSHP